MSWSCCAAATWFRYIKGGRPLGISMKEIYKWQIPLTTILHRSKLLFIDGHFFTVMSKSHNIDSSSSPLSLAAKACDISWTEEFVTQNPLKQLFLIA